MMRRLRCLLLSFALIGVLGSCVIVEDDHHCQEGAQRCNGDWIQECVYDDWEVLEDCWDLCFGTCDYDRWGRTVCVC